VGVENMVMMTFISILGLRVATSRLPEIRLPTVLPDLSFLKTIYFYIELKIL
jgi:hypothetical protein